MMFGALLSALATLQAGNPPPPAAEAWHQVETGNQAGAIREMYVEKRTMRIVNETRFVWTLARLDPAESPYLYKKELMAIDCLRSRYEGVQWVWSDAAGRLSHSEEGDTYWTPIRIGSPAESIMRFVCAEPASPQRPAGGP